VKYHGFSFYKRVLTFQSLVVCVRTSSLQVQKFYILPTDYLYILCVYQERNKTPKFFLYDTQRSDFIEEMKSVYSAVRTGSLYTASFKAYRSRDAPPV